LDDTVIAISLTLLAIDLAPPQVADGAAELGHASARRRLALAAL